MVAIIFSPTVGERMYSIYMNDTYIITYTSLSSNIVYNMERYQTRTKVVHEAVSQGCNYYIRSKNQAENDI